MARQKLVDERVRALVAAMLAEVPMMKTSTWTIPSPHFSQTRSVSEEKVCDDLTYVSRLCWQGVEKSPQSVKNAGLRGTPLQGGGWNSY
jgi:hypothetical protein